MARTTSQPPLLEDGAVEAPRGAAVVAAANPAFFAVNGVRFAACTQDVLRHLSAAEAARDGAGPADRMARLAAHLPGQRSAYPLFPAARAACLDASLAAHLDMDVTPDVLVLPSDLNPFAKVVPRVPEPAAAPAAPALPARVAEPSAPWAACVGWARRKYESYFVSRVTQLLHNFPPDAKTSAGLAFWSPPKRVPKMLSRKAARKAR